MPKATRRGALLPTVRCASCGKDRDESWFTSNQWNNGTKLRGKNKQKKPATCTECQRKGQGGPSLKMRKEAEHQARRQRELDRQAAVARQKELARRQQQAAGGGAAAGPAPRPQAATYISYHISPKDLHPFTKNVGRRL